MAIKRVALRDQISEELLARMRDGRIAPGDTVNEVALAKELGVSRTPLREALIALQNQDQITWEQGRGFSFLPLDPREITELSQILAAVEGLGIELTSAADRTELGATLLSMAEDFTATRASHREINQRDDEWHTTMLSRCPNRRLLEVANGLRTSIHRYESRFVHDETMVERSAGEHAAIARALAADDVPAAQQALRLNWSHGAARLLQAGALDQESTA